MRKRYGILLVTGLFYLAMLILTVGSRRAYLASLAPVTVGSPSGYALRDGLLTLVVAIPPEMAGKPVFSVERAWVNGELRYMAKIVPGAVFGTPDADGTVEVPDGLTSMDVLVLGGGEALSDGKGVRVLNEEDLPSWWN